ncbi:MAG TPA: hypothetical protein VFD06_00475 [Candidatus Polarisedimenticolia bacterium]|nr:hypothetical protein [Candidatus Polarisedimenticolia bacterium]
MAGVPLSAATRERLERLFHGEDARVAAELLVNECGGNLPFAANVDPVGCERTRFAALKLSKGRLDLLRQAIELAKVDWRDLLMAAGFGHDVNAHKGWVPERRAGNGEKNPPRIDAAEPGSGS